MPAKEVDAARAMARPSNARPYRWRVRRFRIDGQLGGQEPMKVAVVASGELEASDARWLDDADLVIAADGGAGSLDTLGRAPDLLVGDLDSVEANLVERLTAAGTRVHRHPADKEASDTELAVEMAFELGATAVVVLGAVGGARLDHELANLLLLADPALAGRDLRAVHGGTQVRALHANGSLAISGSPGALLTLLPVGGDATGVATDGLRWTLEGATLRMGRSRGLSNEMTGSAASIRITGGTLLVVETAAGGVT
jgi:thiamine pyrophosphokinase